MAFRVLRTHGMGLGKSMVLAVTLLGVSSTAHAHVMGEPPHASAMMICPPSKPLCGGERVRQYEPVAAEPTVAPTIEPREIPPVRAMPSSPFELGVRALRLYGMFVFVIGLLLAQALLAPRLLCAQRRSR